jgi:hypothetical protein
MEMSNEKCFHFLDGETGHAFPESGGRAANYARTAVNEIGRVVDHDRNRGPGAVRVSAGIPGAQHHDLSL